MMMNVTFLLSPLTHEIAAIKKDLDRQLMSLEIKNDCLKKFMSINFVTD